MAGGPNGGSMAERLAPNVFRLDVGLPTPLGANAYLVDDGTVTMVDAGLPLLARRIRREIASAGYSPPEIDRVLVTHYDLDHVGGLPGLYPALDVPVYVGEPDIRLIAGAWDPPILHPKGLFHRGVRRLFRLPEGMDLRAVNDRETIGGFTAFHTPGHNPGHTVYIHEALGVAFLGDLVWEADGRLTTPEWYDSYDMDRLRSSIRRIAASAPPFELACMAHGTPIRTGGDSALRALADSLQPAGSQDR